MRRTDRLFDLLQILRDGKLHTAQEMAEDLGVSVRTIYRDMETLQMSGVPVEGERGVGYMATGAITLPPLSLTAQELEALNLGIAIVAEAADPELARAAASLGDKVDAVLPEQVISEADAWKFAVYPFANAARGVGHMHMEYWGRVWTLTAWCEMRGDFRVFRVDLIEEASALPELFTDEAGKTLADYLKSIE